MVGRNDRSLRHSTYVTTIIGRKLLETDLLPQGVVPVYDKDFAEVLAVKVSARGVPPSVESVAQERIEVNTFEIGTIRTIKYSEISIRRFNALDRAKNKAAFELKLAEDGLIFSAIYTAGVTSAQNTNVATNVTRAAMAAAFAQVENRRLAVGNIVMSPTGFRGIRGSWTQADLDQVNMQGLIETGWFASLWNSKIFVTDQLAVIPSGNTTVDASAMIYVLSMPAQLGRMPIRYDVEVKPWTNERLFSAN